MHTAQNAKGVSLHGQVSASFRTAVEQVRSSQQVRSSFSQKILGFSHLPLPTPDKMVEFALNFATHIPDVPSVVRFAASGYEHIPGMDVGVWSQVRDNRRRFQDRTDRQGVNQQAAALMSLGNQIQWIRRIYDLYDYLGDSELGNRRIELEREMGELRHAIEQVEEDPTQPYRAPALLCLTWGVPVLNFDGPKQPTAWGGEGGYEFRDVTRESIMSGRILREITLRGAKYVDAITSAFGDERPVKHGGNGGTDAPPLTLGQHEYVTELRGRAATYLDQLEVVSSADQRTKIGRDGGTPFTWRVPDGSVFVGFAGRAAAYVDKIAPLIITFKPAKWEKPPSK